MVAHRVMLDGFTTVDQIRNRTFADGALQQRLLTTEVEGTSGKALLAKLQFRSARARASGG